MKNLFLIILIFTSISVFAQNNYKIPQRLDSITVWSIKYDFSKYADSISFDYKMALINESILSRDTSLTWIITGFNTYIDFKSNLKNCDKYPYPERIKEIYKSLYYFDIDSDGDKDIIFENLDKRFETHSIKLLKSDSNKWQDLNIKGYIITDAMFKDLKLIQFDTYEWGCCDFPYNFYRRYNAIADTFKLISTTAIPRQLDIKLISKKSKQIKINKNALIYNSYLDQSQLEKINVDSTHNNGFAHCEIKNGDDTYVLIELNQKFEYKKSQFDGLFGWISKKEIKYVR